MNLRWGILTTGNIARQFCTGVGPTKRNTLAAVASRQQATAEAFAKTFRIPTAHGSYDALLADPSVDAVYNALPNHLHHEWTIKALRAGKHVLCEKPLASNLAEAQEMFDVARQTGRLLVEAFMYRSHPLIRAVKQAVDGGAIGELRLIRTSFCYFTSKTDGNIRFDAAMAGGALMDIGCYCINFSRYLAGTEPTRAEVTGHLHASGVDDLAAGTLLFPGGVVASFGCGMQTQADNTATVCGSGGYLEIPVPWKPPKVSTYILARSTPPRMDTPKSAAPVPPPRETVTIQSEDELYGNEANDFAAAVLDGAPPAVTAADSIGNQSLLDQFRRQLGMPVA